MKLYDKNGYPDVKKILDLGLNFIFYVGGRGTGKTYTILKTCLEEEKIIMLMRRSQTQTDMINKEEFMPYKPLCSDTGLDIRVEPVTKSNSKFVLYENDSPVRIIGYTCSLSTIGNMRGFDGSDVDILFYDEFIKEKSEKTTLKYEGDSLLNAYETLNRNRELSGKRPIILLGAANAFDLANPIFVRLGIVDAVEKAFQRGRELYIDKERSIIVINLERSPVSRKKRDTALYRLLGDDDTFSKMALGNEFSYDDRSSIKSMPLTEMIPVCAVGGICIYHHKSDAFYYVSEHASGSYEKYTTSETDLKRFVKKYGYKLHDKHMAKKVYFENYLTKAVFEQYIM